MRRTPVTKDILYNQHRLLSHQLWLKVKWLVFVSFFICGNKSFLLSRISCKHASELKKNVMHQKCFVPANMFSKLTLACMEIGGALKSKYEQNLNKKRNLFFFNFNSAPRWKCIWGAADENQSKSVGRRDLVQARKNFRQLRFILWRIVFYTQAAAAT